MASQMDGVEPTSPLAAPAAAPPAAPASASARAAAAARFDWSAVEAPAAPTLEEAVAAARAGDGEVTDANTRLREYVEFLRQVMFVEMRAAGRDGPLPDFHGDRPCRSECVDAYDNEWEMVRNPFLGDFDRAAAAALAANSPAALRAVWTQRPVLWGLWFNVGGSRRPEVPAAHFECLAAARVSVLATLAAAASVTDDAGAARVAADLEYALSRLPQPARPPTRYGPPPPTVAAKVWEDGAGRRLLAHYAPRLEPAAVTAVVDAALDGRHRFAEDLGPFVARVPAFAPTAQQLHRARGAGERVVGALLSRCTMEEATAAGATLAEWAARPHQVGRLTKPARPEPGSPAA